MDNKSILLNEIDDVLIFKFRNLNNFKEIADMLEISPQFLHSILYKRKSYNVFQIQKKNGGTREIKSPDNNLKIVQKKLAYIISLNYKMHRSSFGFIKKKSIIDNAKLHTNKKWVFNFDLKDFFHQFNQGRVIGLFKKYYKFNDSVAGVLAEICCHDNVLPQGAPTSPILSNILSFELDREFQNKCKKYNCIYSRYVDDITISTNKAYFPKKIARRDAKGEIVLGSVPQEIVDKADFQVNQSKVYLRHSSQNQHVTGLTVNEGVNVSRKYIKKIRAAIHNLRVHDEKEAQEKFFKEYLKNPISKKTDLNMYSVLKGRIQFVGQIKGKENSLFRKLAKEFNDLKLPKQVSPISILTALEKNRRRYCFIVEVGHQYGEEMYHYTGSAFYLKGVGLVSAAHTFKEYYENKEHADSHYMYVLNENKPDEKITIVKKHIDYALDIAIFEMQTKLRDNNEGFLYSATVNVGQRCVLLGYPKHFVGNTLNTEFGQINQELKEGLPDKYNVLTGELGIIQKRYKISAVIYAGNSGGPIIDEHENVIGIAVKGHGENGVEVNAFVPISDIFTYIKDYSPENQTSLSSK